MFETTNQIRTNQRTFLTTAFPQSSAKTGVQAPLESLALAVDSCRSDAPVPPVGKKA